MINVKSLLLILACLSFSLAALGVPTPRVNSVGLGLFFWTLSLIV